MEGFSLLSHEVIQTGLCTGCGTCIGVCPRNILFFDYEIEEPVCDGTCGETCRVCFEVCPGRDIPKPDFDRLLFGRERDIQAEPLGIVQSVARGHATDPEVRLAGASGGCGSAFLIHALETKIVDAVVVAAMDPERPWRVKPVVATSREEVIKGGQSKLTIVPANAALQQVREGQYQKVGFVGLPCHIHGLRKMQLLKRPSGLVRKIEFSLGLLCGANWTYRGTEHVIEELCGTPLGEVKKLEYRGGKYPGNFTVTTQGGEHRQVTSAERRLFCMGFLRDRCTMCYDYAAEFADISIGDYFGPEMSRGSEGWSMLLVRTERGRQLLEAAVQDGYLHVELLPSEFALGNIGFEFKMHGYGYHLQERKRHGWPVPDYHYPLITGTWPRQVFLRHPHTLG